MVFSDHDGIRLSRYYTPSLTSATTMTSFFLHLFGTFKKTCNRDVRLRKPFTTEKSKTTDCPDEHGYEEMSTAWPSWIKSRKKHLKCGTHLSGFTMSRVGLERSRGPPCVLLQFELIKWTRKQAVCMASSRRLPPRTRAPVRMQPAECPFPGHGLPDGRGRMQRHSSCQRLQIGLHHSPGSQLAGVVLKRI